MHRRPSTERPFRWPIPSIAGLGLFIALAAISDAAALSPQLPAVPDESPPVASASRCKNEFIATERLLQASRSDLKAASQASSGARCEALRRHYAAMVAARAVFARCDRSEQRTQHAAQLDASIDQFKRGMPSDCGLR